jgi:hypothetical protein
MDFSFIMKIILRCVYRTLVNRKHYEACEIHTGVEPNNGNTTGTPHIFINVVLSHLLTSIQPQSFLESTPTRFEQSLVEFFFLKNIFKLLCC